MASLAKANLLAYKYAESLASLELSDSITNDLFLIKELCLAQKQLLIALESPAIQEENKKNILEKIFSGKINPLIINLLKLLVDRKRTSLIVYLADNYKRIFYQKNNKELAVVSSESKLDGNQLNEIKNKLEKVFNKSFDIDSTIDPSLLGGLKISIADKVIDYSLKNKLKNLKRALGN